MSLAYVVTHPEVVVDPHRPVPRWHLSVPGIHRMRAFAQSLDDRPPAAVWSSGETKAIEAAGLLAARFGLPVQVHPDLHENDRTATGFVPPAEFEELADAFFAQPEESVRGWERAVDAQARITRTVETILNQHAGGDLAIVAHGAVGTLLLCAYLGIAITRAKDQPFQGHYWCFDIPSRRVLHAWQPIAPREPARSLAATDPA